MCDDVCGELRIKQYEENGSKEVEHRMVYKR